MISIKELISLVSQGEDFYFYCPVFLDSFYGSDNTIRYELIKEEPEQYENVAHIRYCDVAGIAHKLANDYNLSVPDWVHKDKYKLDEPYYQRNTKNEVLQKYYRKVSPYEFRIRNIYIDVNSLERV